MAKSRNSNIELLRILSILIIMWTHLSLLPQLKETNYPFLSGLIANLGGVGDNLFFGITAWFMCNESPNFRKSCRRVWKLEQQLLFYALGLFAICTVLFFSGYPLFHSTGSWLHLGVVSVMPVLAGLWVVSDRLCRFCTDLPVAQYWFEGHWTCRAWLHRCSWRCDVGRFAVCRQRHGFVGIHVHLPIHPYGVSALVPVGFGTFTSYGMGSDAWRAICFLR